MSEVLKHHHAKGLVKYWHLARHHISNSTPVSLGLLAAGSLLALCSRFVPTGLVMSILCVASLVCLALVRIRPRLVLGSYALAILGFTLTLARPDAGQIAFFCLLGMLILVFQHKETSVLVRGLLGAAVLLLAVPIAGMSNTFILELGIQVGIYAAMALGLNVVVGMAGLLDLGYTAFFAIGAYTWAIFGSPQAAQFIQGYLPPGGNWMYAYMFIAIGATALTGIIIGLPALRLKGDYLAIVTLGLGEVVRVLATNMNRPINFTNGSQGITPVDRPDIGWFRSIFSGVNGGLDKTTDYQLFFYFLVAVIIVLILLAVKNLGKSRYGRAWVSIREDDIAAKAMGVPMTRSKLQAFATGAAFSGAMGVLFAAQRTFVSPETFTLLASIIILGMVVLGGMGSIPGVVLGAAVLTILNLDILKTLSESLNNLRQSGASFLGFHFSDLSSELDPAKFERLVFGIILILMMIFRPEGLVPEKRRDEKDIHPKAEPIPGAETKPLRLESTVKGSRLEVKNAAKSFGGLTAVNDVSLTVEPGTIVSVIGPNGAGKTTFFNLLTGVYTPDKGSITLDGKALQDKKPEQIAVLGVGRTFQNIRLFGAMTVLENVLVGSHSRQKVTFVQALFRSPKLRKEEQRVIQRSREILAFLDLSHRAGELSRNLSYGEQRRLEIARALALEPSILLLDEPAAGMNPQETEELKGMILRLRETLGITIVLIEHDMAMVMSLSDRITVLEYGSVIAEGTPEEIRRNPRVIEAYLGKGAASHA